MACSSCWHWLFFRGMFGFNWANKWWWWWSLRIRTDSQQRGGTISHNKWRWRDRHSQALRHFRAVWVWPWPLTFLTRNQSSRSRVWFNAKLFLRERRRKLFQRTCYLRRGLQLPFDFYWTQFNFHSEWLDSHLNITFTASTWQKKPRLQPTPPATQPLDSHERRWS